MKSAVSTRLRELAAVATKLADIVDEEGRQLLPGLLVCRTAEVADRAANELEGFADLLTAAKGQRGIAGV
jgi:hypothetical protein